MGAIKPRLQCTVCANAFSWPTSVTQPLEVFPLVCGDVICRVCLGDRVRGTFGGRGLAPVRCCERAVPHEYVRQVLEHAEDVYYSFLVNQTKDDNVEGKIPAKQIGTKQAGNTKRQDAVPLLSSTSIRNTDAETEAKSPPHFQVLDGSAAPLVACAQEELKPTKTSIVAPEQRSHDRGSRERFTTPAPQVVATPSSVATCHMCHLMLATLQLPVAPCGHYLCQNCVKTRVLAQLSEISTDISAGVPVSCCGKPLPLDVVQRVITGQNLTKYTKMMVKNDITANSATTTNKRAAKRKSAEVATLTPSARKLQKRQVPPASFTLRSASQKKDHHQDHQEKEKECNACFVKVRRPDQWFLGPCGHGYCRSCITKMVHVCLEQRDQVPVRCCSTDFPIDYVEQVLSKRKFEKYNRFLREQDPRMSTLRSDRAYAKVVRKHRGKQCPVCGIGVLKIDGCQAMRCALGHTFCWGCGKRSCVCG